MNETGKPEFDSIPLGGFPGRSAPDLSSLGLLSPLPKPATPVESKLPEPKPAPPIAEPQRIVEAEKPAEPKPPMPGKMAWVPEAMKALVKPTKSKGIFAAGLASLALGAVVANWMWPVKQTPAPLAMTEQAPLPMVMLPTEKKPEVMLETPAPLPVLPSVALPKPEETLKPASLPDLPPPTVTAAPAPLMPAVTAIPKWLLEIEEHSLVMDVFNAGLRKTVAAPPPPPIIAVSGSDPVPLPTTAPAVPTMPTVPQPGVIDAPKLDTPKTPPLVEAPKMPPPVALPTLDMPKTPPVIDTPKLPVPAVTTAVPKPEIVVAPTTPPPTIVEVKPPTPEPTFTPSSVKPTSPPPALDMPALPKLDEPKKLTPSAPVTSNSPPREDYDVDVHYAAAQDRWESISKQHLGDERYADALRAYNNNRMLQQGMTVDVPPIYILRKQYPQLINAVKPVEFTAPKATGAAKNYEVPAGGITFKELAKRALGDEAMWGPIWELNPKLRADEPIPAGTRLRLPADSRIGE